MNNRAFMGDLFLSELTDIVGYDNVLTSEVDKLAYSSDVFWIPNLWLDRKKEPLKPDYIVQPGTVEEIQRVLALANRERIPVTPWGGGSGSQGGILPVYGGITLDLKRLNRILEIDEESHTVTVEAGINNTLLELALNERGLTFPHYPASSNCASIGGFIAGDDNVINYLRHNSRSYIFSASNTPAATAAASAAFDIMVSEPERIENLWKLTKYALEGFRSMGFEIGHTSTPIIPLYIRDNDKTFIITKELFEQGIFVNPVVSPAVASTDTLIRFSLMATHTFDQLNFALDKIEKVFRKMDLLYKS